MTNRVAMLAIGMMLCASSLRAQTPEPRAPLPSTPIAIDMSGAAAPDERQARAIELADWIRQYRKFQKWDDTWRNYVYPFGRRRQAPEPPAWLASACTDLDAIDLYLPDDAFDDTYFVSVRQSATSLDPLQTGCLLLQNYHDDYATAQIRRDIRMTRVYKDTPQPHTVIWELVNLDVMYAATSIGSPVRAPIGVHVGFPIGDRVRLFAAPGAILLCVEGFSNCRPAYDYGVGIRLFDFHMPGFDRTASAHLNLAKAWILGAPTGATQGGIDIAGFSIAFKRR
jgi:hypothetical protein